ncbi:hypothetical protein FACS1894184_19190 [Clostridia bacterium]|nr:hypothetical protein FACS1894184_19190 [Clostridia bacterium]
MNNVRKLRRERDISQKVLCAALDVTQSSVSQWESGKSDPSRDAAIRLAEFFNVSIDEIFAVNAPRSGLARNGSSQAPSEMVELFSTWNAINAKGKQFVRDVLITARRFFPIEIAPLPQKELDILRDALDAAADNTTDIAQIGLFETGQTKS